jgi:hypothetical protein
MADAAMSACGFRLKTAVREFSAKWHKSGNKIYDESHTPSVDFVDLAISLPKSSNRLTHCCESQQNRISSASKTDYQIAELL